ncbi:MAG TPA: hypothetical protein VG674_18705 [Amycolatopsis sp.]|nr:hypothetical protein [Amycolatopsis sp.]
MTKAKLAVIVAVVVLVVAAIVGIAGGRLPWAGGSAGDRCDIPDKVSGELAGVGAVSVVEQGFTQDQNGAVSVGAVLANTGKDVAYHTKVTFRLFDGSHTELPEAGGSPLTVEVPVIMPGQRIGTGEGTYRSKTKVASVEIGIGSVTWVPQDAVGGFSPVTAKYVRTARFNPRIPTSVDIHYLETSTNCRDLDSRTTAVLFRDTAGKLVGGGVASPDTPIVFRDEQGHDLGGETQRPATPSCARGQRETWIVPPTGGPSTADDTRTEIYPYCDFSST